MDGLVKIKSMVKLQKFCNESHKLILQILNFNMELVR